MFSWIFSFFGGIVKDKILKVFFKDLFKRPVYVALTRGLLIGFIVAIFIAILHIIFATPLSEAIPKTIATGLLVTCFWSFILFITSKIGRFLDARSKV